jgi:hypothetical protein
MSGASYGSICGVLYVNKWHQTVRCFSRGHAGYGGRCREHEEPMGAPRTRRLCGWQRSPEALPCANSVWHQGSRCHLHTPLQAEERRERLRTELEEKLARRLKQARVNEREIGWIRAELERIGPRAGEEAAE